MIESELDTAVKLTESAAFPLAIDAMKFEIFPPGQAATSIIPKAKLGRGWMIKIKINVSAGSNKNWDSNPAKTDLGCFKTHRKSDHLRLMATPNMIKPKLRLR